MGFTSASVSFTRFRIIEPVPDTLWPQVLTKLQQNAFKDIDNSTEERSFGWTCFEDMLDTSWRTAPPQKANYLLFSLRLDTRRIPAAVIKKYLTLALQEEKAKNAEQGKNFISRERKKELKEQVILRLRQRFLPVPAEFHVVWDTDAQRVWFASTQSKMVDMFVTLFTKTFDLTLEQLRPFDLALGLLDETTGRRLDTLEATNFAVE